MFTESNTASKTEHKNDIPTASEKYNNNSSKFYKSFNL